MPSLPLVEPDVQISRIPLSRSLTPQKNINRLKDKTRFTSWIYQIVRRGIIDFYRQGVLSVALDESIQVDQQKSADNHNKIVANWLKTKIKQLPDKYRSALELTETSEIPKFLLVSAKVKSLEKRLTSVLFKALFLLNYPILPIQSSP